MSAPSTTVRRLAVALAFTGPGFAARAAEAPPSRVSAVGALDVWRNLQGGLRTGDASVAAFEARLDVDAERVLGWRGTSASLAILATDSNGPSSTLLGDLQTADNKDATRGVGVYEAWIRRDLGGGYLKMGVVDLNSEFSVSPTAALFINGAQGLGLDLGQVGAEGPSVYPAPRLGVVAAGAGPVQIKAGVFDGLADTAGPRRRAGLLNEHGALGVVEASGTSAGGLGFRAGAWRHSANFGSTLEPVRRKPASGAYAAVEGPLWRGPTRRLSGLLRIGAADARTEQVALHLTADLVLERPFGGPDGEALGLGIISAWTGDHARREAHLEPRPGRTETVIEATYRTPLGRGFFLQPDIQYIIDPGARHGGRNAVLVGARLGFDWASAQ